MTNIKDFVTWAGTQRAAAELIGMDESTMSLILAGKRNFLPQHATAIETATSGVFRCEDLIPAVNFVRDDLGAVVGWVTPAEAA